MQPRPVLRLVVVLGLVLWLAGTFVLNPPASLWAQVIGSLSIVAAIVVVVVQTARARRRADPGPPTAS